MPSTKRQKTRGDELADLINQPKLPDYDPEAAESAFDSDSASESDVDLESTHDGREHYETVSKSKLRGQDPVRLGSQYSGLKVARKGWDVVEEEHDPFEGYGSEQSNELSEGANDKFGGLDEDADSALNDAEDMTHGIGEHSELEDAAYSSADDDVPNLRQTKEKDKESDDREELKRMLKSQRGVASSLVESQRADIAKGIAVRKQQKAFDALVTARVRLQSGLVAFNTLPTIKEKGDPEKVKEAAQGADAAARKLWGMLDELRCTLLDAQAPLDSGKKRKRGDESSSLTSMWEHMSSMEVDAQKWRRSVLAKWSAKTQPVSIATTKASGAGLNLSGNSGQSNTLLDHLDAQVANSEKMVQKFRIPKSCAPVQAKAWAQQQRDKSSRTSEQDGHIDGLNGVDDVFDDSDFYQTLLKDLLERRQQYGYMGVDPGRSIRDVNSGIADLDIDREYRNTASKSRASKKQVDTRASKGRKMRYTVHEKLLNFMVPENRGTWSDKQATELFSGLFGAKSKSTTGDVVSKEAEDEEIDPEEQALRLFRN